MSDEAVVILASVLTIAFITAIPVNLYAAREFRHEAGSLPRIAALILLSWLVQVLAVVAITIGVAAFLSVLFLTTGIRLIPPPGTTVLLIVVALYASFANVRAVRYLRRMRRETT